MCLQAGGEVLGLAIQKGRLYASVEKTIKFWKLGEIEGHKEDVSSGELSVRSLCLTSEIHVSNTKKTLTGKLYVSQVWNGF